MDPDILNKKQKMYIKMLLYAVLEEQRQAFA